MRTRTFYLNLINKKIESDLMFILMKYFSRIIPLVVFLFLIEPNNTLLVFTPIETTRSLTCMNTSLV